MMVSLAPIGPTIEAMLDGKLAEAEILAIFHAWDGRIFSDQELAEAARALRKRSTTVDLPASPIDTCGTGGSGKNRINASTIAAFVAAAAGVRIAKHGNRASGGRCGSFDLLEGLGARIDLAPEQSRSVYEQCGIAFLFAPNHHPAMRFVGPARKAFGKRTIFNLLGPLCNPAGAQRQIVGVPSASLARLIAAALRLLGSDQALVVSGSDGLDEVTVCGTTHVCDLDGNERMFDPATLDIDQYASADVEGGDRDMNVAIAKELLAGRGSPAHRDLVLVNAAHAITLAGRTKDLREAFAIAKQTLASGAAGDLAKRYAKATHAHE